MSTRTAPQSSCRGPARGPSPTSSPAEHPSPFELTNFASGDAEAPFRSIASFQLRGTVTGPGGTTSDFFGVIATSFPTMSFQEALQTVEATGIDGIRYTARFTALAASSTVPEPSTWALVATGLCVVGAAGARRRRRVR